MIMCDEVFATAASHIWAEKLDAEGMVWSLIQSLDEVIDDPQVAALGAFVEVPDSMSSHRTISPPFDLRGSDGSVKGPAPVHGQHTREILSEVGLEPQEIQDLFADEIVF